MHTLGLNHIILTVSDVAQSRAFYGDLLGFDVTIIDEDPDKSFFFTVGGVQFFWFPSRQPMPGDQFSEFRIGLDHLAFTADRKSTRLNSSHANISYAVFCLKKKNLLLLYIIPKISD